jgi:hypothetical protein
MARVVRPQGSPAPDYISPVTPTIQPSDVIVDGGLGDRIINDRIQTTDTDVATKIGLGNMGGGAGLYAFRQGAGFLFKSIEQGNGVEIEVGSDTITLHSRPTLNDIEEIPNFDTSAAGKSLQINNLGNGVDWQYTDELSRSYTTGAQGLSGHRVVKVLENNTVNYADLTQDIDGEFIAGVTRGAALAGDAISVQFAGSMVESSWSWTLGPVFCGAFGVITQTPPSGRWLRQIGTAVASDTIMISLRPLIVTLGE